MSRYDNKPFIGNITIINFLARCDHYDPDKIRCQLPAGYQFVWQEDEGGAPHQLLACDSHLKSLADYRQQKIDSIQGDSNEQ